MVLTDFENAVIENNHARLTAIIGADPEAVNSRNEKQITPLVLAVARGTPATVDLLIRNGAEIDVLQGTYESTALITAVTRHRQDNVVMLLRHGVDVNMKNGDGRTALDVARGLGYIEIERLLKKHGAAFSANPCLMLSLYYGRHIASSWKGMDGRWHLSSPDRSS